MKRALVMLVCGLLWWVSPVRAQQAPDEDPPGLYASLWAGPGIGTRSLRWPGANGPGKADAGPHGAVDVGTELSLAPRPKLRVGLFVMYQTSFGLEMQESRIGAADRSVSARSHHVNAGLHVRRQLGERLRLLSRLGYDARNYRTLVVDSQTPPYTLSGPTVSLGLEVQLGSPRLRLRVEPELLAILQVGPRMQRLGVASAGLAAGGRAAVAVRVVGRWSLELVYYGSWARVSGDTDPLRDALQFATLRVRGEF